MNIRQAQENLERELWAQFEESTRADPRGGFYRIGDDAAFARHILAATAAVMLPLVVEIGSLRRQLAELREEIE